MRNLRLEFLNYAAINANSRFVAPLHCYGLWTWHDADQASVSRLRHSASPGRAVSATAPTRASAQRSGRLTTWAMPASTGIRTLIGSSRVPGSLTSGIDWCRKRSNPGTTMSNSRGIWYAQDAFRKRDARGSRRLRMRATTDLSGRPKRVARSHRQLALPSRRGQPLQIRVRRIRPGQQIERPGVLHRHAA